MLESLAKCYFADLKYPERTFFQERLELLEEEESSTSKLMMELGKQLGLGRGFVALWSKLSQDWIHTKGVMDRVVSHVVEKSDVPAWALVIPMNYTENDLEALDELRNRISQFRELLTATVEKYQQELGFCTSSVLPSDNV